MKKVILSLFFISIFVSFFLNINKIEVPYFGGIYKNVGIDLTLKNDAFPNVFINDNLQKQILKIDNRHYLIQQNTHSKIDKIRIENPKNIEKIFIYNGNNIEFPSIEKEISIDNSKDFLTCFSVFILSLFYNPQYYIISYILLFIFLVKYKVNYNNKILIPLIFILSFLLRITSLNAIPFWDDEIYTITITEGPFLNVFNDPGNPPLYFIFFKLFRTLIRDEMFFKFSSVIIGLVFNYVFYFWLKKNVSKKVAITGLLLSSVNIVLIYRSQELRGYTLLMTLAVLCSIFLFNFKKKNKVFYFLSSLALLYTHFYGTFLFLYNFIFGIFYLTKKRVKNFVALNLTAFIMFLPILFFKKESIASSFNTWIKIPDKNAYFLVFKTFSGSVLFFFIFIFLSIFLYNILNKKRLKIFLKYNIASIGFVFFAAIIFSYLIKPVFYCRYFHIVYPMYLAIVCLFAEYKFKFKYGIILTFIIIFIFGLNSRLSRQNLFCNHNMYLKFIQKTIDNSKNNYIFMTSTVEGYKKFENMFKNTNAKIIYFPVNEGINDINPLEENLKPPFTAYILNLYLKNEAMLKVKNIDLYKTPLGVYLKTEF